MQLVLMQFCLELYYFIRIVNILLRIIFFRYSLFYVLLLGHKTTSVIKEKCAL